MPEPVALLSSVDIPKESFFDFLRTTSITDTKLVLSPREYCDAQLIRGNENIWIVFESEEPYYYEEDEEYGQLLQKLGGHPRTDIIIDISSTEPESQHLAVEFACAFTEQWPCVVDNLRGDERHRIYSAQEIRELCNKGIGFWDQK